MKESPEMSELTSRNTSTLDAHLAAYQELCKSYHAIDDFRMKLLGLLPLASLVGVFLLQADTISLTETETGRELVGFASIFAALLTIALFSYEMRGIRRCHNLITEGLHLETVLGIGHGQFHVCSEEHADPSRITSALNAKFAACTIYSLVFASWLFMALRFGFDVKTMTCCLWAVGVGFVLACLTYFFVHRYTST